MLLRVSSISDKSELSFIDNLSN